MSKTLVDFLMFIIGILIFSGIISLTMLYINRYKMVASKTIHDNDQKLNELKEGYEWKPYNFEVLSKYEEKSDVLSYDEGAKKKYIFNVLNQDINKIYPLKVSLELYEKYEAGDVFSYITDETIYKDDFCRWVDKITGQDLKIE